MDHILNLRASLAVACAAALVSACDRQATADAQRSAEKAGQRVEKALERTGGKTTTTIKTGPSTSVSGISTETRAALGDGAITASIKMDFLKDPDLSVLKIDVDTRDGVVTLNGLAGNEAARGRAEKLASAIKGVREVRNNLTVKRG